MMLHKLRLLFLAPFILAAIPPPNPLVPVVPNTVATFITPKAPASFPNMQANYQQTVVVPQQQAAQAALEAAQQAQAIQPVIDTPAPVPVVYTAPALPTNDYKSFIYMHESGNNPGAINASSGACGLGQALPCSKMPCSLGNYACQDSFFTDYMLGRYGSWAAAYNFWTSHNYW